MKNFIHPATFFLLFLFLASPYFGFAAEPLIPCGGTGQESCEFSDFAKLFNNVMNFLLVVVMVPVATLSIVFVGIQYMTAFGNPGKLSKAHETLMDVLWGIFIAIAAYAIIRTIFIILTNYGGLPSITG